MVPKRGGIEASRRSRGSGRPAFSPLVRKIQKIYEFLVDFPLFLCYHKIKSGGSRRKEEGSRMGRAGRGGGSRGRSGGFSGGRRSGGFSGGGQRRALVWEPPRRETAASRRAARLACPAGRAGFFGVRAIPGAGRRVPAAGAEDFRSRRLFLPRCLW